MTSDSVHERIRDDMNRAVDAMNQAIAEKLFADPLALRGPLPPPTWKDRLRWKLRAIAGYFAHLWTALKGEECYRDDEY